MQVFLVSKSPLRVAPNMQLREEFLSHMARSRKLKNDATTRGKQTDPNRECLYRAWRKDETIQHRGVHQHSLNW